jgi:hypothetical protein
METVMEKKIEQPASLPVRARNRLRKEAELRGVPPFALRLLTEHRPSRLEPNTTRFGRRHD